MFRYDRLNALAQEKGIKKAHICRKLGRSAYYLRDAEKVNTDISDDQLAIIAEILRTTPAYLRGETDNPEIPSGTEYSDTIVRISRKGNKLSPEKQRLLEQMVDALLDSEFKD